MGAASSASWSGDRNRSGADSAGAIGASSGSEAASAAEVGDGCRAGDAAALGAARSTAGPDGVTSSEGDAPSDTEVEAGAAPEAESRRTVITTTGKKRALRRWGAEGVERKRLRKCSKFLKPCTRSRNDEQPEGATQSSG